jgi:phosphoribosylamine--glycine ligase
MRTNHIPTADYQSFTDSAQAKAYIQRKGAPIVIKADGLSAGKGVVVAETIEEANAAVEAMLEQNAFGESGAKVVIEEFLAGEEFSLLAFVKGEAVYPMVIAQDHKRAFDGDLGPNTGGMGAYTPVPQIPQEMVDQAVAEVLLPAAKGMIRNNTPFTGILYAGLIATNDGPKVIEFNARFGDPETQVVLSRLESSLAQIIDDLLQDQVPTIQWNQSASIGVVIASQGYPGKYQQGMPVPSPEGEGTQFFYAGVDEAADQGGLTAAGGRVFLVEASAENLAAAQKNVYEAISRLSLSGLYYRNDIGDKALQYSNSSKAMK